MDSGLKGFPNNGKNSVPINRLEQGTAGKIPIAQGTGADVAYKALSADATISATGALTLSDTVITSKTAKAGTADNDVILIGDSAASNITKYTTRTYFLGGAIINAYSGIIGVVDASSATTGNIGQVFRSQVGVQNIAATNTWQNITSITLSAGDWDVAGVMSYGLNGATMTAAAGVVSINSGITVTDHVDGDNSFNAPPPTAAYNTAISIPQFRINSSTSTTMYLKALCTFSAGTPQVSGRISARRMR